ncbi:MAG: hypothetical protein ACLGSD_14150 [Acidobacteriota bacterium]
MRNKLLIAGLAALLLIPGLAAAQKKTSGSTLVIVFKDGHRQTFNLADIARVEFPGAAPAADHAPGDANLPPRGRYIGKWEVGEGAGFHRSFTITLKENGEALRSLGNMHGKWAYVNGAAEITWDDGWQDAIRRVGPRFQKFAYAAGKKFTDTPDNVTDAHNTTPRPI